MLTLVIDKGRPAFEPVATPDEEPPAVPSDPRSAKQAFDTTAASYDVSRRQLIPCFDPFYSSVLDVLAKAEKSPLDIIDLGAGTGLMSAMILGRFPAAYVTLVDAAENMLDIARHRLAGYAPRVRFVQEDLLECPLERPYDAVVSGLAIHHLHHADKRALFARVHAGLRSGGCFVNADQMRGATDKIEHINRQDWLRQVKDNGVTEEALSAALGRMSHDIPAPLDDQLGWLRAAGFNEVACVFDGVMFAVYTGQRGGEGGC